MSKFLKKKECKFDHTKFYRFVYNEISILVEKEVFKKFDYETDKALMFSGGSKPSESYRLEIFDITKPTEK